MTQTTQQIEVEVVEIDGVAPTTHGAPPAPTAQNWQGRIRTLDARWWPLWVLLGTLAIAILLTVGLVIAVIFVIFRILNGIGRALFPDR